MLFEYAAHKTFMGELDVVDPGNMCLRCVKDGGGYEWYLMTKTRMGKIFIFTFGPVVPGTDSLVDGFATTFTCIDYKENLLRKNVLSFINDPKKEIYSVEETLDLEAWKEFPEVESQYKEI